ncbi:hypothetical protein ACFQV2_29870 [Actinokineospora soli]|uniref:Uncharacterized protein n=1 Tax=Actinokineospora soli TaxID=1048753 RepID=A0ABW2TTH4_9PSEU
MSPATARAAVTRIAEHAGAHGLDAVEIVLHGGEPLLAGRAFLDRLARDARARIPRRRGSPCRPTGSGSTAVSSTCSASTASGSG